VHGWSVRKRYDTEIYVVVVDHLGVLAPFAAVAVGARGAHHVRADLSGLRRGGRAGRRKGVHERRRTFGRGQLRPVQGL
jgi:hypothetical protein